MNNKKHSYLALAASALILASCTVGPDYEKPQIDAPPKFVSQEVLQTLNEGKQDQDLASDWWAGFNDPILNQLVEAGLENNFEIAAAMARVKEAQARVQLAGAEDNLTSDLDVGAEAEERKELNSDRDSTTSLSTQAGVGFSLPFDIFGRTRRNVEAARANLDAARRDLESTVLVTSVNITSEYLTYRGDQRQLELLMESVSLQEKTLSIVRSRFDSGLSPELDLQRAISSVESLRAQIPPLKERLQNSKNRLASLTGQFPGAYEDLLSEDGDIPVYSARIPDMMPLDVLNTRPDIRQSEEFLKAAIANIGVAEAEYYPVFELTGSITIGSTGVSSLPTTDVLIASLAGLISQVITSGGERDANLEIAKAQAEEALANYELLLRNASQEVEASLNAIRASAERQESLRKAVQASQRSFSQSQTLYRQGLISFLDVVEAQQDLADDEQDLAAENTDYVTEIANLFRVLGVAVKNGT